MPGTCCRSYLRTTSSRRRLPSRPILATEKRRSSTRSFPTIPAKPYDIKRAIELVVDDGDMLEVHERYAENIVCCLARLGGHVVGVVGNQPRTLAGVLDIDSSVKAARFVRTCDAFNIPLVTFVDVPGLLAGHRTGVARDHPARREAPLRVRRSDRAEARRHHAQGLRRRVRRHELEAHPRRLQLRLADGGSGGDGPGGRGEHRVPQRAGGRERRRQAPAS